MTPEDEIASDDGGQAVSSRNQGLLRQIEAVRRALEDQKLGLLTEMPERVNPQLAKLVDLVQIEDGIAVDEELEYLSDGILRLNSAREIVFANRSAVSLLGYEDSGQIVLSVVDPILGPAVDYKNHAPQEIVPPRTDGVKKNLEIRISAERRGHILVVIRDITLQKTLEKELQISRDRALELAESKANFLANMSHEIRTPMNGVLGMVDALLDSELDAEQREHALLIQSSGSALIGIINDILDFSKLESGRIVLEYVPVDLRWLMRESVELLQPKALENAVQLGYEVSDAVPQWVLGDPTRIRQIVLNLLSNAVKFTKEGSVTLKVDAEPCCESWKVTVRIVDTGIGIHPDRVAAVFDKFSQAEASTTRKYGGTGLGLTISRQLAELMKGDLNAHSRGLGFGSEFVLSFPAERPDEKAIEELSPQEEPTQDVSLEALKVLLAEDNKVNQKVALRVLGKMGCDVTVAENGRLATEIHAGGDFDVILMDCQMPEMDGLEATRQIRLTDKDLLCPVPIIALTANAMKGDRERCLQAGMNDYVSKPFKYEVLHSALARCVKPKPAELNPMSLRAPRSLPPREH